MKEDLAEVVIESLRPLQEKFASLTGDNNYLDQILSRGAERAEAQAEVKIQQVSEAMGLQ